MIYKLREICDLKSGGTPSRANPEYFNSSFIPWVKVGDLEGPEKVISTEESISESALLSIGNRFFEEGTLLVAMYGSVGKTAIAGTRMSCNQAVLAINLRDKTNFDNKYLKYWFDFHKSQLIFRSKGGTLKNLSKGYIENLEVDFPNIDIQREVIYRIELLESLVRKRQQTTSLCDQLLTSTFYKLFGSPLQNEKQWETKLLNELGDWKTGGTPPRQQEKYYNGTIPWFTSGELNSYFVNESAEKITELALSETSVKRVAAGSLLIGMYDTAAMKTSIVQQDCACNQAIAFADISEKINPIFVQVCLRICKDYYLSKRKGARQKNLNLSFIKSISIIQPPSELQDNFINIFKTIELQKINMVRSKELFLTFKQKILYKIFTSESEVELDEIDQIISDEVRLEVFLNSINASDYENEEQYNTDIKKLYAILKRTDQRNMEDSSYKNGLVQRFENNQIIIETNKEYKYRIQDEASQN